MRDDYGRDPGELLQLPDLDLHVEPQILVEGGERLIEQKDVGRHRQRTCERDTLLLPARELARQALRKLAHPNELQHLAHAAQARILRDALGLESVGDVLADAQMRKQRIVLEDDADPAPVGGQMIDGLAVEQDLAGGLPDEAADDAQQGRFAAAGWAEKCNELAGAQAQRDMFDGRGGAERVGDLRKLQ